MDKPRPSSVRVLIRPPPSPSASSLSSSSSRPATSQTHIPPPVPSSEPPPSSSSAVLKTRTTTTALSSSAPSQPRLSEGVVVVGFIGGRPDVSSQLINRVVDSNAFGSGNLDKILCVDKEEVRDWFKWRRISYYHDEEKGILYLQFCSIRFPTIEWFPEPSSGFDSAAEEHEFGDLQGMLFMFSVCHVIINIQEGITLGYSDFEEFSSASSSQACFGSIYKIPNYATCTI
ncbi:Smg8/Smg9 [Quillaja saponaria]|uniref:Nonsense-mediated mRNA decay factor SMG8 n=1 Tax=Quillaja saponaria TaxID=32244 RepID=A0AAD7KXM0_QUISA|nr:Smg8/Smg9 [Quillaja saponaria]